MVTPSLEFDFDCFPYSEDHLFKCLRRWIVANNASSEQVPSLTAMNGGVL